MKQVVTGRRAAAAVGAGFVLVVAGAAVLAAHGGPPASGPARVKPGLSRPPGVYVRSTAAYGLRGRDRAELEAPVAAPLMGPLSPVAVNSPDARYLAYNSWFEPRPIDNEQSFSKQGLAVGAVLGTPSLRVFDTVASRDFLLERGAYSIAWRSDGALAYARGVAADFRVGSPYEAHVVVRPSLRRAAETWTVEPGRYVVYGWAGSRLLVYRVEAGERLEVLVLDRPGKARELTPGSIVALSPDGSQVLVAAPDNRHLRVLNVSDGSEAGALDLSESDPPLEWIAYSGSWKGDRVVAAASAGLVVLHVAGGALSVEQLVSLDRDEYPAGVQEPEFADEDGNEIVATADLPPRSNRPAGTFFLDCDRGTRTCERGDEAPARDWLRLVRNPSRPTAGGE